MADRLLLTLPYYRAHVTREFVGFLFGVDQGTVSRQVPETGRCLAGVFRIPEKKVRLGPDDLGAVPVGATEPPVHRPTRGPRRGYSGEEERHTVKHHVVVTRKRQAPGEKPRVQIKAVSKAAKGRIHDAEVCDRSRLRTPGAVPKAGDSGYQGRDLSVPKRKPRNGQLRDEEGRANRELAKDRMNTRLQWAHR